MSRRARALAFCALAGVLASGVALVRFSPRFVYWQGLHVPEASKPPEVNRATVALTQIRNPLRAIDDPSNKVLRWRLLPPVVAHLLRLPDSIYLALPWLGCLAVLVFVAHVFVRETGDRRAAFAASVLAATSSWFFVSTGWLAYFDSWYVLGLLLVGFARPVLVVALACLLVPWIDERFVLGLPLALTIRILDAPGRPAIRRDVLTALGIALGYVLLRAAALLLTDVQSQRHLAYALSGRLAEVPPDRWSRGLWHGLRAGWVFVLALPPVLGRRGLVVVLVAAFVTGVAFVTGGDVSRCASVALPAAVLGALALVRARPLFGRRALLGACVLNLLLPTRHIVTTFEVRITALPAQLDAFRSPPFFLAPGFYLERGGRLAAAGELELARASYDSALTLDPDCVGALVARGSLLAAAGDLEGARRDLERGLALAPATPEGERCRAELESLSRRSGGGKSSRSLRAPRTR